MAAGLTPRSARGPRLDVANARKNSDLLLLAAEELGWQVTNGQGGFVVWVLFKEDVAERLKKLRDGEWLSHLPGMQEVCGKVNLGEALQDHGVTFWPRSWRLPAAGLDAVCKDAFSKSNAVIVKPDKGSQGQGISLAHSSQELHRVVNRLLAPEAIIQEYLTQPLLLDGYKWDARIYVLVIPHGGRLRCFLADEGLARVCVQPYEEPTSRNLHRLMVHLTNYSLSKFSEKYEHNADPADGSRGCKRTLTAVLQRLGISAQNIWASMSDLVRETVEAMTEPVAAAASRPETWDLDAEVTAAAEKRFSQCFHVLGFDIILDRNLKVWLLEVNNNPSLSIDEVRPLADVQTRAEANQLFATIRKGGSKWGRPCRCAAHPRPHQHNPCPIDVAVKLPVALGALTIVKAARDGKGDPASWAAGTTFQLL